MKAIVTVGLGFGDEGKGATMDFLARTHDAEVVVRYSGGSQAGHNVQRPDGARHTFSQFGAGTLAGAKTYLGPRMIISPATMIPEAEHLQTLGVADPFRSLSVHPDCLVSTTYHMLMNRLREVARGDNRHGSCGLGIGESRHYWLRYGQDAIFAGDLRDPRTLKTKLTLLRDRFLLEMQELSFLDETMAAAITERWPSQEADSLEHDSQGFTLSHRIPHAKTVLFEGAQGVLLDEWKGFHPYTTWSTVTTDPAWELIEEHEIEDVTVLGLTRAYTTRHGSGPFPTFDPDFTAGIQDLGNPVNDWQGAIRCGPLDFVLLKYAMTNCRVDGLVVNNLDQVSDPVSICPRYENHAELPVPHNLKEQAQLTQELLGAEPVFERVSRSELFDRLNELSPVVIQAMGPTCDDRQITSGQTVLSPPQ